jgi:LmbE family N-acetylglucosaminyl deacetylase
MRILAVSPHPDDVDVGCAGFLIRAHRAGHYVDLLVVTNGESGGRAERRRVEQIAAARAYNSQGIVHWLGLPDTTLIVDRALVETFEVKLTTSDPDLILIPHGEDTHQDHRAVHEAVMSAARYRPNVLAYETPTSIAFAPELYVDVTDVWDRKLAAVQAHISQIDKPRNIVSFVQATSAFRGWHARTSHAEGYRAIRLTIDGLFSL